MDRGHHRWSRRRCSPHGNLGSWEIIWQLNVPSLNHRLGSLNLVPRIVVEWLWGFGPSPEKASLPSLVLQDFKQVPLQQYIYVWQQGVLCSEWVSWILKSSVRGVQLRIRRESQSFPSVCMNTSKCRILFRSWTLTKPRFSFVCLESAMASWGKTVSKTKYKI